MPVRFEVLEKRELAPKIKEIVVHAPLVARSARPGQFVIIMVHERGERIPLTLVDWSRSEGWVKLVFLEAGASTTKLGALEAGDALYHVVGPLGRPSDVRPYGEVALVSGGVANAAIYPIAKALSEEGNEVHAVIGARSASILVYERELSEVCDSVRVATDDGSKGFKGFVSQLFDRLLSAGELKPGASWIVGPAPMMKACAAVAAKHGVKAFASLNPLMLCGMGMCGTCRVTVGGRVRFACIEGPEFDASQVDWDELILRLRTYEEEEKLAARLAEEAVRRVESRA